MHVHNAACDAKCLTVISHTLRPHQCTTYDVITTHQSHTYISYIVRMSTLTDLPRSSILAKIVGGMRHRHAAVGLLTSVMACA